MLTTTVAPSRRSSGSLSATKRWTPIPCSPIAFSMPAGVSTMRGGRMAFALGEKQTFDRHAPERREVHRAGVFDAVARSSPTPQ